MKKIIAIFMLIPALLLGATRPLVPNADREGYVGKSSNQWGYGYFSNLFVNNIPITGSGTGWTNTVGSTTFTNKGLEFQNGTNTRWVTIGGTNYLQLLTNSMGVLYAVYAGYSSTANVSSNLTESASNSFMRATGGVYNATSVFRVGDGISSYFQYNVIDQIFTLVRDGNTFTFDNDGLTISGLGGKFIGDLTGTADYALGVSGAVHATTLDLNNTSITIWASSSAPTQNMVAAMSSANTNDWGWTNAPVLAGLTMSGGNINLGGSGTISNGNFVGNGPGLSNLQNTISYMNTNTAAYDFSTSGGSCGTLEQNPAWTNILNVTNKGIAVGCRRIKFMANVLTASGTQTNIFGLSWATNASGQTAIGAFTVKSFFGAGQVFQYGEIPVDPATGEFYYYCSTNTTAGFTITGAEF